MLRSRENESGLIVGFVARDLPKLSPDVRYLHVSRTIHRGCHRSGFAARMIAFGSLGVGRTTAIGLGLVVGLLYAGALKATDYLTILRATSEPKLSGVKL